MSVGVEVTGSIRSLVVERGVVYVLAASAALCSAVAGVLQRIGVEQAPAGDAMRLRLLTNALKRGIWLLGFALLLVVFVLQASALRFGDLTVVQPILTVELLFLIAILGLVFHRHVGLAARSSVRWRSWSVWPASSSRPIRRSAREIPVRGRGRWSPW